MIRFEKLEGWHMPLIEPQDIQASEKAFTIEQDIIPDLVENSFGLSCWVDDVCVGAAGFKPIWTGRAVAWALVGKHAGPVMLPIVRKLQFFFAACPVNRIEMTVRESFMPGCRLARVLGFRVEARLLGFFPDGSTAYLFTRMKQL